MRTMCSREIFKKKCRQQQIFDSDLKGAWQYNHVTFTPIAKNFTSYRRLIYMLSILCVILTIKVKVGILESFKVGWYPPPKKKLGRVTLNVHCQPGLTSIKRKSILGSLKWTALRVNMATLKLHPARPRQTITVIVLFKKTK